MNELLTPAEIYTRDINLQQGVVLTIRRLLTGRVLLLGLALILSGSFLVLRGISSDRQGSQLFASRKLAFNGHLQGDPLLARKVDDLFNSFVQGEFREPVGGYLCGGPRMFLPTGAKVDARFLELAARPVISLGQDAVPQVLKWVRYDNEAIRFLAVCSLEEITGIKSEGGYLLRDKAAREEAIVTWATWWQNSRKK